MTDKEITNITEINSYLEQKEVTHTGAYSICTARVTYKCRGLETIVIPNAQILYCYSFEPSVTIDQFQPPYHSDFRPAFQYFRFVNGVLAIHGVDKNGRNYQVTIE